MILVFKMKASINLLHLCVCVLIHTVSSVPNLHIEWNEWKQKYGKTYSTSEKENAHLEIWSNNYNYVQAHNAKTDKGFQVDLNQFADQVIERASVDLPVLFESSSTTVKEKNILKFVPSSWDWRSKGAIGPVRNQGQLGDVQSIVAAECVQSYKQINTGRLTDVSSTEIHDCCVNSHFFNKDIFKCIHNIGGLCSGADYPLSPGTCRNTTCSPVAQINGGKTVTSGDETALMEAVYKMPVLALVDASHRSFQLYRSGIYSEPRCSTIMLDHALQIVGYGSMNGEDYWICKNSWGTSWGDSGYINIARNKKNMCGIATQAEYPV